MHRCVFCDRSPVPRFALTAQNGDQRRTSSWRREVLPVCPRCHRALAGAGREGRVLKATGERWYLGHTVGIFESRGALTPVDNLPAQAHNRGGGQLPSYPLWPANLRGATPRCPPFR